MKRFLKETLRQAVPTRSSVMAIAATRFSRTELSAGTLMDEEGDDPLSRAQILASIRAAKRLRLPTGEVLRAVRRQIDLD
ncbi:MAG: hypothetical protein KDN22_14770 [Verrucomicrobiae bacterium]|nr:hypothetical protein [Verrucomicrobiae bacterium]